jgi:hypothetical protein
LLSKPVVTSVIVGAKRTDQLQDNLAAVDLKLTDDELKQLDDVSALPPGYPGWMLPSKAPTAWIRLSTVSEKMEPREGGKTSAQLATLADDGASGRFFHLRQRLPW